MKTSTLRLLATLLCAQIILAGSLAIAPAAEKAPSAAELKKREDELRKREMELRKKQEVEQQKKFAEQKKKFVEQQKKAIEQQKKAIAAQKKAYDADQKRLAEMVKKKQEEDAKRAAAEKKKKQEAAKANPPPKSTPAATAKATPAKTPKAVPAAVAPRTPAVSRPVVSSTPGAPASTEPKWSTLFDGKSTAFFRGSAGDAFPKESWAVEGGALKSIPDATPADLLSRLEYENFEMDFEWKVKPGAKSALVYRTKEADGTSHVGPAMALVNEGKDPKLAPGALAGLLAPSAVEMKPAGEFNQGKLVVLGDRVEHWVNGQKVLEYDWNSPELKKLVGESKLAANADFMSRKNGYLAFQHGGDEAWFRNIRLRRLSLK